LQKEVLAFGKNILIGCDEKCNKAWGINSREKNQLSEDEDDYCFLSDDELGIAPIDPGTYECTSAKPKNDNQKLNKWCFRECERLERCNIGEELKLHDWSKRFYNMYSRRIDL